MGGRRLSLLKDSGCSCPCCVFVEAYAVRSVLGIAVWFGARLEEMGSGRRARPASFRVRNPRFTEPSGFIDPRWVSAGGL